MVLTEMGNGVVTGTVIPHEGTLTYSTRVEEMSIWEKATSASN